MDNVMQNGNPAARLLDVILEAMDMPASSTTRAAWSTILKSGSNQALMYERLGKVMQLSEETSHLIKELFPRQKRATDSWKATFDKAFAELSMNSVFINFQNSITHTAIDHLTSAVDLLESKNKTELSPGDIGVFIDTINDLISEVLNGEFEQKVKEYLARSLRKIVIALEEYRLTGSILVTDSIEQMLGHSFFDKEYSDSLQGTDLGKKILGALGDLANAVTVATPIVGIFLTEAVKQTLGLQG